MLHEIHEAKVHYVSKCLYGFICSHMTKLFVETYHVMYVYLMGDSRKNELYIAKYIDFFQSQFELREVWEQFLISNYYVYLNVIDFFIHNYAIFHS